MSAALTGRSAVLRVHGHGDLHGTVEAADRRGVTVVLPVAPVSSLAGAAGIVECATPLGVHRVHGRLEAHSPGSGVVRLVRDGGDVLQRREWARVEAVVPVTLGGPGGVARVFTRDVSAGGMLVQDPFGLAVGDEVHFALELAAGTAVPGRGPVTGVRVGDELAAVRFDVLADADRERIVRWAMERQRAASWVRTRS